jgi:hypothetical protein
MGFVPYNQEDLSVGTNVAARNIDSSGVGIKEPVTARTVIPLAKKPELLEKYQTVFGGIRIGRLLEDIDAFGANVAYRHCDGLSKERPLTVVTANFDKIDLQGHLIPGKSGILVLGLLSFF